MRCGRCARRTRKWAWWSWIERKLFWTSLMRQNELISVIIFHVIALVPRILGAVDCCISAIAQDSNYYETVEYFNNGFAYVSRSGKYGLVNTKGQEIIPIGKYDSFGAWQLSPNSIRTWGFRCLTANDDAVAKKQYFAQNLFAGKYIPVKRGGKWGAVDANGYEKIKPQYDNILTFRNNHTVVQLHSKWLVIDRNWRYLGIHYNNIIRDGNFQLVKIEDKWGVLNEQWDIKIEPKYKMVRVLDNDIEFAVKSNRGWGILDSNGRQLVDCLYDSVGLCASSTFGFYIQNQLFGICRTQAVSRRWIILSLAKYRKLDKFSDQEIKASLEENKWGLLDAAGDEIVPLKYNDIVSRDGMTIIVMQKDKFGAFNVQRKEESVPTIYDKLDFIPSYVNVYSSFDSFF